MSKRPSEDKDGDESDAKRTKLEGETSTANLPEEKKEAEEVAGERLRSFSLPAPANPPLDIDARMTKSEGERALPI